MKYCILGCMLSLYMGLDYFSVEKIQNINESIIFYTQGSAIYPDKYRGFLFPAKAGHSFPLQTNREGLCGITHSLFYHSWFIPTFSCACLFSGDSSGKWRESMRYLLFIGIGIGCEWVRRRYLLSRSGSPKGFPERDIVSGQPYAETFPSGSVDPWMEIKNMLLPKGISRLRENSGYDWLLRLEEEPASPCTLHYARRLELQRNLRTSFSEALDTLRREFGRLSRDDQLYCLLILLGCSQSTIIEVTGSTYEALKTRKSRLKSKMPSACFESLFSPDNRMKIKDLE